MSVYSTVIREQERIIKAYSDMLHELLEELAQHRSIDEEEKRLKELDEKGGIR